MPNKVRYGLRNTKYAIYDPETDSYGELRSAAGAVSLTLSKEGGDSSDFYADDGVHYTFAGTNGGYSGDFNVARLTDEIRRDLLGEVVDDATGVQFEVTDAEPAQFALVTEMQGDKGPIGFVFYNCKASRPDINANTKTDNPDVDTDTLNIRIAGQPFELNGETKQFIQGHIEKDASNADKFSAFFKAVAIPGKGADAPSV